MVEEKRKRCPNWLPAEKNLLVELVEKHLNIIEHKKTDASTMKRKNREWQMIMNEYNKLTNHCSRSSENLKNQWESMKKYAKKESRNWINNHQDGVPAKEVDPLFSKIMHLIKASAGLFRPLEKDSMVKTEDHVIENVFIPEEEVSRSKVTDSETDVDENEYTQVTSNEQDLTGYILNQHQQRTPLYTTFEINRNTQERKTKPKILIRKRQLTYTSSLEKLHEKKMEAIELQKRVGEKELINLKETHEIEMQIKREQLKQEKLKTRILFLDLRMKKKLQDKL